MIDDISTFATPASISEQLDALKIEVRQLHQPPDNNGSTSASWQYKMPTFWIEKFDDYTHQDPVTWWQGFTTALRIHQVPDHLYISALFLNARGGCQIWLSHMATIHGVQVADLHKNISWEDLMKEWKKRFIVDDAPMLAINRLFQTLLPTMEHLRGDGGAANAGVAAGMGARFRGDAWMLLVGALAKNGLVSVVKQGGKFYVFSRVFCHDQRVWHCCFQSGSASAAVSVIIFTPQVSVLAGDVEGCFMGLQNWFVSVVKQGRSRVMFDDQMTINGGYTTSAISYEIGEEGEEEMANQLPFNGLPQQTYGSMVQPTAPAGIVTCYICGKAGHYARNCWSAGNGRPSPPHPSYPPYHPPPMAASAQNQNDEETTKMKEYFRKKLRMQKLEDEKKEREIEERKKKEEEERKEVDRLREADAREARLEARLVRLLSQQTKASVGLSIPVKKKSPTTKAQVSKEITSYLEESEDESEEVKQEAGRLIEAIERRKGKKRKDKGDLETTKVVRRGGKIGQAYVLPKDKDLDRWRPISPAVHDPASLAGARVGRAVRYMLLCFQKGHHFDLKSTDDLRGRFEQIRIDLGKKGGDVLARSYDIKDMFAKLSHEVVLDAVRWLSDFHITRGMLGVQVSRRGKLCAMTRIRRKQEGFVLMTFGQIERAVKYELGNTYIRSAGVILRQQFGIPMGRSSSPALACLVCARAESDFLGSLGRDAALVRGVRMIDDVSIFVACSLSDGVTHVKDVQVLERFEGCYDRNLKLVRKGEGCNAFDFLGTRVVISLQPLEFHIFPRSRNQRSLLADGVLKKECFYGDHINGLRHGEGSYIFPNRVFRYHGDWQGGQKEGHGVLIVGDLASYEGDFCGDEITGYGVKTWRGRSAQARECVYSGQFLKGEMHGQGVFWGADGHRDCLEVNKS
ncbi:hypothetical protein CBR_g3199 [Chara braunii]|uniref:CCHC-type domain-containing protein n=1 Tax=Chara braunii TaxID=69332 RepID=A0A388KF26_CHABU|nr:hypothetical protein CBR_g3199 [Chara braunii]|eukprot:GBG68658.1 hypothetical protein CBR_g3199 [Chara braunii]